jgi:hypothetical protein
VLVYHEKGSEVAVGDTLTVSKLKRVPWNPNEPNPYRFSDKVILKTSEHTVSEVIAGPTMSACKCHLVCPGDRRWKPNGTPKGSVTLVIPSA